MIITISGTAGSGKSSVARSLAKKLNYKCYSAGDVRGKYAIEHGLTIDQLNKQAENDPTSDFLVDNYMKQMADKEDGLLVDARLGFYFIPKSIKVFVDGDENVRVQRVFKEEREDEHYRTVDEAKIFMRERQSSDVLRYKKLYDIDPYQEEHYDLVIDSSSKTVEQCVGEIYRFIMFKEHELNHEK